MKNKVIAMLMVALMLLSVMAPAAVAVEIPEFGTKTAEFNGHTYVLVDESMTWKEAKAYCEEKGGYLATVTSQEEQDFITGLIEGGTKCQYWLGATDEGHEGYFRWITGEPFDFIGPVEDPSIRFDNCALNAYGAENYMQIIGKCSGYGAWDYMKGYWNDACADNTLNGSNFFVTENVGFICEFGGMEPATFEGNGHTYVVYDTPLTWTEAKTFCEEQGGYLATITSQAEQDFIVNLIKDGYKNFYWLGASDDKVEGNWQWVTGESFEYTGPGYSAFDNFGGNENYLQMWTNYPTWVSDAYDVKAPNYDYCGTWNDTSEDCSMSHDNYDWAYFDRAYSGFICEFGDVDLPIFNGHTYYVFNDSMTWAEAKAACEAMGGYLATITSQAEQEFIEKLIATGTKKQYWLGATDEEEEGNWKWVTGEPFIYSLAISFDNAYEGENYLQILREDLAEPLLANVWNDANNEGTVEGDAFFNKANTGYICEFGDSEMPMDNGKAVQYNGHTYVAFDLSMTWKEAEAYCERLGGTLATITSAAEQAAVEEIISTGTKKMYWLGGTDEEKENIWKWVTGEPFVYWNESTCFDNAFYGENYLQVLREPYQGELQANAWNDANNEGTVPAQSEQWYFATENTGFVLELGTNEMPVEKSGKTPIIYIIGRTIIYNEQGQSVIPGDLSTVTNIVEQNGDLLAEAVLLNSWTKYSNTIYNGVEPLYRNYRLNNDGEVDNGSHIAWSYSTSTISHVQKGLSTYQFEYDGRLDPCDIADDLKQYIDDVKAVTGSDTVHIVSRCLGCNIATAYFAEYGWDDVETAVFYASAAMGYDYLSDLFSGNVSVSAEALDNFVDQRVGPEDIEDDAARELVKSLVHTIRTMGLLKYGTSITNTILRNLSTKLIDRLVLATYGTCPGYWSMINDTRFEEAKKFVFGDEAETTYKNLVEKIDNFHYNVMNNTIDMLKEMDADGVKINVICKYGLQTPPFVKSSKELSDNTIDVYSQSFYGATCAYTGRTLTKDQIKAAKANGTDKFISPDKTIDSSTALFPDQTWYIKNYEHNPFFDCFNEMIMDMCYSETQLTVFDDARYPQYLIYDPVTSTYAPLVDEDAQAEETEETTQGSEGSEGSEEGGKTDDASGKKKSGNIFVRIIRAIANFIRALFGLK